VSTIGRWHVLYCEDHDDTRILMSILLERAGFQVTTVTNAADCLKLAARLFKRKAIDLYLLDHTFPDASGVTICRALREFDLETPILFYSARAMLKEKEEAIKAGAQDYLIKPDDLFNVAEHVAKWISETKKGTQE